MPRSRADMRSMYAWQHAREEVDSVFLAQFVRRKQYIGQIELLGVLVAYTMFGRQLFGRRVLHFIDNTSGLHGALFDWTPNFVWLRFA